MEFLKNLFAQNAPSWASVSETDWKTFVKQLRAELRKTGVGYTEDFDKGAINFDNGRVMGLLNMLRTWASSDLHSRRDEIAKFVRCIVLRSDNEPPTWEEAESRLRIRIHVEDWTGSLRSNIVSKDLGAGLRVYLMLDSPEMAATIKREAVEAWGVSDDEALKTGQENLFRFEPCDVRRINSPDGQTFTLVFGESIYAAAYAIDLGRFIVPESPNGVVAMLPDRRTILFAAAEKAVLDSVLAQMVGIGMKLYNEADGPISPSIYWWKDGIWTAAGGPTDTGYSVRLPEALVALM